MNFFSQIFFTLRGCITISLMTINLLIWAIPLYFVVLAKLVVPWARWRARCSAILVKIAEYWISGNNVILGLMVRVQLEKYGHWNVQSSDSSMIICNHQSWTDIIILQNLFHRNIPFIRFFLKKELIRVPFLGPAWWALDFPFMKRYSKQYLLKHPEKRGKDLETTKRMCQKFQNVPVTLMNFLEGTRFSKQKKIAKQSPFVHLLPPKAGGFAFALNAMEGKIKDILNVTIVYPQSVPHFWHFLCGRIRNIIVHVERLQLPPEFSSFDYLTDHANREAFQKWVGDLWARKDALIERINNGEFKYLPAQAIDYP